MGRGSDAYAELSSHLVTGCISKVSKNTWQGKYTPRSKDGKRERHIVYAKSEEECERKLKEMIGQIKIQGTDISELC